MDDWYRKAKQLAAAHPDSRVEPLPSLHRAEVISFHYVNQVEAALLHRLLRDEAGPLISLNPQQLFELWPRSNEAAGPYSRRMVRAEEAETLLKYLKAIRVHR